MGTETNQNFYLKKAASLDARLVSVANAASLPDLSIPSNFLFEGATIFVEDLKLNYQAHKNTSNQLVWVNIGGKVSSNKQTGVIKIIPTTTIIDCELSSIDPNLCDVILIEIVGGTVANISSIINFPTNLVLKFKISPGQSLILKHEDYDTATVGDIVIEDGFDFNLTGRQVADEFISFTSQYGVICQYKATQFLKKNQLSQLLSNLVTVENSLTSTSTTKSLSALQGKVLNDKFILKQDKLTPGTNINLSTSNNISVKPITYTRFNPSIGSSEIGYLTTNYGNASVEFNRFVDFRSNQGNSWLLPAGSLPNLIGNWILVDAAPKVVMAARYIIAPDSTLSPVNQNYCPRVVTNTYSGDNLNLTFNSDGPSNEKIAFALPSGTYKIRAKINMLSDKLNDLRFTAYEAPTLPTASIGVPTTNVIHDVSVLSSNVTNWTDSSFGSFDVEVLVTSKNDQSGNQMSIVFGVSTVSDFTNTSFAEDFPSYLDITKIK